MSSVALPSAAALEVFASNPRMAGEIAHLQTWLSKQRHLPRVTDQQLVPFLNSCNHSLEAAKSCIDAYYTCKSGSPEFFSGRDPLAADLQHISTVVQVTTLSTKSPEGYVYVVTRLKQTDTAVYFPDAALKLGLMVLDAIMRYNPLAPGIVLMQDMRGVQFAHMAKVDLNVMKKHICYVEQAMPIKLKAIHVLNVGPVINAIMGFVKPFISKEHLQLIHFHAGDDGLNGLDEFVPKSVLPKDYGGDDATMDELFGRTMEQLVSYRDWFKEDEAHCKVDESKRQGKMKTGGDLFGKQGSFKKLDFD